MKSIHGSCVELDGVGVLLRGSAGSGKSDLAVRLIDAGGRLVADDQVVIEAIDGELIASAPPALCGLIEVRGIGIQRTSFVDRARLALVVDLVSTEEVERLPEPAQTTFSGVRLPLIKLCPFEASAAAKVRLTARKIASDGAIHAPRK